MCAFLDAARFGFHRGLVVGLLISGSLFVVVDSRPRLALRLRVGGGAPPAPRRCTSRARSTSTRRYIEQGGRRTASLVHCAVVRTSRSSLRQRSSSRVVKLDLRSFIRTRFVVLIVGTLIVRSVTPRRSRTPSRSRSDSAWSASLQGATSTTSSLIMRSSWHKILAVSSLCVLHYLQGAQRPPGVVQ